MNGIGIIINVLAVLVGGGFGLMFRGKLKVPYAQLIYRMVGFGVLAVGAYTFIQHYFTMSGGEVELTGSILVILALLVGGLFGYLFMVGDIVSAIGHRLSLKDEKQKKTEVDRLNRLSRAVELAVEKGMNPPKVSFLDKLPTYEMPAPLTNNLYADGFLIAVVFLCANAMLFDGVMADAMSGETKLLIIKSVADFTVCFALAMICGAGPLYAVIPMTFMECVLFLCCLLTPNLTAEFFDPTLSAQLCVIGAVITVILGIQMAFDRKKPAAVMLLPSALIPLLYYGILFVVNLFLGD